MKVIVLALASGLLAACSNIKQTTENTMGQEQTLTQEWVKVFPLSKNEKK